MMGMLFHLITDGNSAHKEVKDRLHLHRWDRGGEDGLRSQALDASVGKAETVVWRGEGSSRTRKKGFLLRHRERGWTNPPLNKGASQVA